MSGWLNSIKNFGSKALALGQKAWRVGGNFGKKVVSGLHNKKLGAFTNFADAMTDGKYGLSEKLDMAKDIGVDTMRKYKSIGNIMNNKQPKYGNVNKQPQPMANTQRAPEDFTTKKTERKPTIERMRDHEDSLTGNLFN